jgi:acyl-CoA thioesterase
MLNEEQLNELRSFFKDDKFATGCGCELVAADVHYAKAQMKVGPEHRNAYGGVMGGAIFTLADFAFAVASNQNGEKNVASGMSVSFVGNTQDDLLTAEAVCVKNGKKTCLYNIEVLDSKGKQIAYFQATGFHL